MSKNKGNILLPLLAGALVVALAVAGFLFWQNQQNLNQMDPPPGSVSAPNNPKSDLKVANWISLETIVDLNLKYPPSWHVKQTGSSQFPEVYIQNIPFKNVGRGGYESGQFVVVLRRYPVGDKGINYLEELISRLPKNGDNHESSGGKLKIHQQEKIEINGIPIVHRVSGADGAEKLEEYFFLLKDGNVVSLYLGGEIESNRETFNQILSTFKFIDQAEQSGPTSTVKVYYPNKILSNDPTFQDCTRVFPVERTIPKTQAVATAAVNEWLKGPTSVEKEKGFSGGVKPGEVTLRSINIKDGVAVIDLHFAASSDGGTTIRNYIAGTCGTESFTSQLNAVVNQFSTVKDIIFAVDGSVDEFNTWAANP